MAGGVATEDCVDKKAKASHKLGLLGHTGGFGETTADIICAGVKSTAQTLVTHSFTKLTEFIANEWLGSHFIPNMYKNTSLHEGTAKDKPCKCCCGESM